MDTTEDFFSDTKKKLDDYIQQRILLVKLQAVEKASKLAASLMTSLIMCVLVFFIVFFLSMMAGYFFASVTGNEYVGFGIVAGFYLVLFFVLIKLQKKAIQKIFTNKMIRILFDQIAEPNDDNE